MFLNFLTQLLAAILLNLEALIEVDFQDKMTHM